MDFLVDEHMEEFHRRRDQIRAWYDCAHAGHEQARRRVVRGGVVCVYRQCAHCGENLGALKKSLFRVEEIETMAPYDETLLEERRREMWDKIENVRQAALQRQQAAREERNTEWWAWYNEYLSSPEWARRRDAVLRRAAGICEGCGSSRASQAHHLTYDHVGEEFLFELVALCAPCHQRLHGDRRAGAA